MRLLAPVSTRFPTLAVEFPAVIARYGDGTMMPSVTFASPLTGVLFVGGFCSVLRELPGSLLDNVE